jgi:hypothetical protein
VADFTSPRLIVRILLFAAIPLMFVLFWKYQSYSDDQATCLRTSIPGSSISISAPCAETFLDYMLRFENLWPVFVAFGIGQGVHTILEFRAESRAHEDQEIISKEIEATVAAGETDPEKIEHNVLQSGSVREGSEALIAPGLQRILSEESKLRREAEAEIRELLSSFYTVPRGAKRIINQVRLLLRIAIENRMLGDSSLLQARHIGKWTVLLERWPELSPALIHDPSLMTRLESVKDIGQLSAVLDSIGAGQITSKELLAFLMTPTKLSEVSETLIYFRAA